jgi:predicted glycosyltransferase
MKILMYCQHVLGVGHYFRSLEICRALSTHQVVLVSGGPPIDVELPPHVSEARLPELRMDAEFRELKAPEGSDLEAVKHARRDRLFDILRHTAPALLLVELYPFGRRAFRFEIDPLLRAVARGDLPPCRVACSVRDILVEKHRAADREQWTVDRLNRYFGAVLVHTDPQLLRLEETFGRAAEIRIPVVSTGFVSPRPAPGDRARVRARRGLGEDEDLIVVSAGGGSVGFPLLAAAIEAFHRLPAGRPARMALFTGPFMPAHEAARLAGMAGGRVDVQRFSPDFLAELAAADLSVSMGGYNTTMNLLAAEVPALVWPFARNREQGMRAGRLARLGALELLGEADLNPSRLAEAMGRVLARRERPRVAIDLNGAAASARWLEAWARSP